MYKQHDKIYIKNKINEILEYQKTNELMKTLNDIIDVTDKQVKTLYSIIEKNQTLSEEDSENLTKFTKLNKEAEEKSNQQLKTQFSDFEMEYPGIFNLILHKNFNSNTLNHVLDTYDDVFSGKMSFSQGYNTGVEYLTKRDNLPDNFFQKK
jgi:hypothetical protein